MGGAHEWEKDDRNRGHGRSKERWDEGTDCTRIAIQRVQKAIQRTRHANSFRINGGSERR